MHGSGCMVDLSDYEHPNSPVRDDDALAPGEDLDREPDGIPHSVMAGIFAMTFVIAAILLLVLSGHVPRHPGALLVTIGGVPALIATLRVIVKNWRVVGAHASR